MKQYKLATLSLINNVNAGEDIDEWDWRSISENDYQDDEYCTTSVNDELVTHVLHL